MLLCELALVFEELHHLEELSLVDLNKLLHDSTLVSSSQQLSEFLNLSDFLCLQFLVEQVLRNTCWPLVVRLDTSALLFLCLRLLRLVDELEHPQGSFDHLLDLELQPLHEADHLIDLLEDLLSLRLLA